MLDSLLIASALLLDGRAAEPAMPSFRPAIVASVERTSRITLQDSQAIRTRDMVKVSEPREIYFKSAN